jgi:hypothetical protein
MRPRDKTNASQAIWVISLIQVKRKEMNDVKAHSIDIGNGSPHR